VKRVVRLAQLALVAAGFSLTTLVTAAASAVTESESQVWTAMVMTAKLGDPKSPSGPSLWLDEHYREGPGRSVFIVRPALGFRFSKVVSGWLGYAWVPTLQDDAPTLNEHRIWQQAIVQDKVGAFTLQARPRVEQRFRSDDGDVGARGRLFLRGMWRFVEDVPLDLVLWDEIFVAFNDTAWGQSGGFDQNRAFVGPAVTIDELRLEAGYLNVAGRRADESWLIQHNLSLWAFITL
jgi:hypothetical protein